MFTGGAAVKVASENTVACETFSPARVLSRAADIEYRAGRFGRRHRPRHRPVEVSRGGRAPRASRSTGRRQRQRAELAERLPCVREVEIDLETGAVQIVAYAR